uniref:Putative salivary lipocalin n=1 Tax=Ixodes ricinus TaxID=34613 RepID=A0A6B0V146_IXORI
MAWTIQAAFFCLLLKLNLVEADFTNAVKYIYDNSQAIRLLFHLADTTFYVVGGTFTEDPLLRQQSGIPFMCGQVKTKKNEQDKFFMERQIYTNRLNGKWLKTMYDMIPKMSSGYSYANSMDALRHQGNEKIYSGTIYLLLSDSDSCALFYHKDTSDCELWEKKRPGNDGLPSSFCARYISACNQKNITYYYKHTECHK